MAQMATITHPLSPRVGSSNVDERPVLLWVDDFAAGLALYQVMFERLGFRVLTASNGHEALEIVSEAHPDVVVTDYEMPEMDGEAVAAAVKALRPATPVIMFSGSTLVPRRARRLVDAFCDKAAPRDQLLSTVHALLNKKHQSFLQPAPLRPASHDRHRTIA
jgi:CheY-like chemotaxis protein